MSKGKVALIGSGVIGCNWAILFARSNYMVYLYDISSKQLELARENIINIKIPLCHKFGMLNGNACNIVSSRIKYTTNLSNALKDAIFIQTGVPENLGIKQKVLSNVCNELYKLNNGSNNINVIISSSSSTLLPSNIIGKMKYYRNNVIISHPVNPPMAIPCVEIVPHKDTYKWVKDTDNQIMKDIGMVPINMKKEYPGFIVNTLQYALLHASYNLIENNVADPNDIDNAVKHGLGLRWSFMGPFETIHLNAPKGVNDYCQRYYNQCLKPCINMLNTKNEWNKDVYNKIHDYISRDIPVNEIPKRWEWRDNYLMNLAKFKKNQPNSHKIPSKL